MPYRRRAPSPVTAAPALEHHSAGPHAHHAAVVTASELTPYPGGPTRRLETDDAGRGGASLAEADRLAEAVDAAARGEEAGWTFLFDRFYGDVHAYAAARLGDRSGVEEVTQEVFVAAVGSIRRLRERREPAVQAWFLHICRHKVLDHIRRRARADRVAPPPPLTADDPGELAASHVDAEEVRRAMERLTEEQRDTLVRRFVLDQSLEEVAAATGRTVGAVKSLQHRALGSLGRLMAKESAA